MKSQHVPPYLPAHVISVDQLDSCFIVWRKSRPCSVIDAFWGSCENIGSGD